MNVPAANTALSCLVSEFASVAQTKPCRQTAIRSVLEGIRDGKWQGPVEHVREVLRDKDRDAYKEERVKCLPAFTCSGLFSTRNSESLTQHSGLLMLDFDDLGESLASARATLERDPHVLTVFVSPSGNGLKAVVPIAATDAASHKSAFHLAEAYFAERGLSADPSGKDVSRLCFISHDPELWIADLSPSLFLLSGTEAETSATASPLTIPTTTTTTTIQETEDMRWEAIAGRLGRLEALRERDPASHHLYETLVAPTLKAEAHRRNEAMTELVPFLFNAVSGKIAEDLATAILEVNRDVYTGPIEEHMKSIKALWDGCEANYPSKLKPGEARAYQGLSGPQKAVFRICRDLALRGKPSGTFFMAGDELKRRVSCNGWRELKTFCGLGILEPTKKGTKRATGIRGTAGTYRWMAPQSNQPNAPVTAIEAAA